MIEGFARRYRGHGPHYEVWYGKVDISPDKALWFRYTTLEGVVRQAATWAIVFDGEDIIGGQDVFGLGEIAPSNCVLYPSGHDRSRFEGHPQVFHIGDRVHLDEANALGRAGEISWDLRWEDSGRQFRYIPHVLETLKLAGSTYDDCLLDVRMTGTIRCGDKTYPVEGVPGMVGHIQGKRNIARDWAWSHCNCFDDDADAAFEGLSARAKLGRFSSPPLTGFVVFVDGRKYPFLSATGVLRAQTDYGEHHWRFETEQDGVRLTGQARSPERVALVEYTDTDGSNLWCYNSKLSDLEIRIQDARYGMDRTLKSTGRAAFEHVTRVEPAEEAIIGGIGC